MQLETVSLNLVPRFKELTALWTRAALRNMNSVLMGFQSVLVFEGLIVARGAAKRGHFFLTNNGAWRESGLTSPTHTAHTLTPECFFILQNEICSISEF